MFVNVKKLKEDGIEVKSSITEFYPLVDNVTMVPASKISKRPYFAFGDCQPDAISIGALPDKYILSEEEYVKELRKLIKETNEVTDDKDLELDKYFEIDQLYSRYILGVSKFALSGVISIVDVSDRRDTKVTSDLTLFIPSEGVSEFVDIESYWKSLMYAVPNIVADVSTVLKMYESYIKYSDWGSKEKSYPSKLLLMSEGIKDFVDTIKDCLEETDLTNSEISKLVSSEEVKKSSEMTPYFKKMLTKHDTNQNTAADLIPYAFESYYEKLYDIIDMSEFLGEDMDLILNIKFKREKQSSGGSII